ncbi:hypothetical protein BC332_11415 [Capsicum chinense]|nr:hypothetical protein BC332_11415 [Capsicum chinense]
MIHGRLVDLDLLKSLRYHIKLLFEFQGWANIFSNTPEIAYEPLIILFYANLRSMCLGELEILVMGNSIYFDCTKFKSSPYSVPNSSSPDIDIRLTEIDLKLDFIKDLFLASHFYLDKIKYVSMNTRTDIARLKLRLDQIIKEANKIAAKIQTTSDSLSSVITNLTFHEDQNDGDEGMDNCDDVSNYDDDDDYLFYENDDDDECDYLSMQAQFDNADLTTSVEETVSWLNEPASSSKVSSQVSFSSHLASGQTSTPINFEHKKAIEDELMKKYQSFKNFDVVEYFSDHHCTNLGFQGQQKSYEAGLFSLSNLHLLVVMVNAAIGSYIIYVRVCEAKKDPLRDVIIEPQGTPYHDGLFVFDVLFPQNYPNVPTMVYYYSGSLRLNPNLYNYEKVCLGLLNTWSGKGNEKWLPKTLTMLQVLVSIQALILNANPFFDEPEYETSYAGYEGERRSHACHEDAFVLCLKTMTYTLRRPPKVMIVYPGSNF